jgi:hypothetical protein
VTSDISASDGADSELPQAPPVMRRRANPPTRGAPTGEQHFHARSRWCACRLVAPHDTTVCAVYAGRRGGRTASAAAGRGGGRGGSGRRNAREPICLDGACHNNHAAGCLHSIWNAPHTACDMHDHDRAVGSSSGRCASPGTAVMSAVLTWHDHLLTWLTICCAISRHLHAHMHAND